MALLSRTSRIRAGRGRAAGLVGLALAAGLLAVGCALLDAWGGTGEPAFSHALHVGEEELDCLMCHEDLAVSDDPGMPARDTCLPCHEALDEELPPGRGLAALFADDVLLAAHVSRLEDEVRFSHLAHVRAGLACATCHEGIEASTHPTAELALTMDDCTTCHADRSVDQDCATCHGVVDVGWAPDTHDELWKRRHGRVARARDPALENRCSLCHEEESCARCHSQEAPESHDPHWRLRGHGLVARMDRQNCAACHEPDSCNRCHADVLPLSHTGTWGGTRSNHCLGCHLPLRRVACVTCHQDTPSHSLARPKPAWHDPSMNCRQCHLSGVSMLQHADDGTNCNLCHP